MLSVKLTYVSPPSLSSTLLLLCLLPRLLLSSSLLSLCFAHSLFFTLSLFHPLSLFLTPFTQMLPAAQLDRSDGMCQIGITPIPTFYTASREAGWVAGLAACWEKYLFRKEVKWRCGTWYSHENKYSNLFLKLKNGLFFCVIARLEIKHLSFLLIVNS